jgi:hypothetical protein
LDVPNAIAAIRLTNAHAKSDQLVMLLTSFVFIRIIFFLVLAFLESSLLSCQFRPFADVQNGNEREVMRKIGFAA